MRISFKRSLYMAVVGGLAIAGFSRSAQASVELFTTQDDFAGWVPSGGVTTTPVAVPDSDGSSTDGLVNGGAAGTAGSASATAASGSYDFFYGPGVNGNLPFMSAIDPGSTATTTVLANGTISVDFIPPAASGGYFQLGMVLNYTGNFGQFFNVGSITGPNANGFYTESIPYTINPVASLTYFQVGLIFNSSYAGVPFNFDNIQLTQIPEPASATLMGLGSLAALGRRRRKSC